MFHSIGGSKGIRVQEARVLMELPVKNLEILPSGGDDILKIGAGTHPTLHHLRASQARLFKQGGLRRISMVVLIKVGTRRLSRADVWDIAHFVTLIYRTGTGSRAPRSVNHWIPLTVT